LHREDVESLYRSVSSLYPQQRNFAQSTSSGTAGPRTRLLFDRSHQRGRNAARARYLGAHRWHPLRRTAWLTGGRFLEAEQSDNDDKQFISRLLAGVQFFSNSIALPKLADLIAQLDPLFIYIYPSMLDGLLRAFERQRQQLPSLRQIFTGAEILDDSLRQRTQHQLGVSIADNYGSTEAFLAWQCPLGNYHQNAEHVLIEIVDDTGREVAPGHLGRVLITTLQNHLMPLVRYEIGDYAIASSGECGCGRTLPLMGSVAGRGVNLFRSTDGRLINPWDLANTLRVIPEISMFQVIQKTLDRILVKYVSEAPVSTDGEGRIRGDFERYLGRGFSIEFERTSAIERTPGGKFMMTLSEVSL
jgi:phenylacetate-coenzyme A ligase PaaK-like adenylate-forming protein